MPTQFKEAFHDTLDPAGAGSHYANAILPDHIQQAMSDYITRGFDPGGFVSAMLAGDIFRVAFNADVANRDLIYQIARWIVIYCPPTAYGSYEKITDWCNDSNGIRTKFMENYEKRMAWEILGQE
jgi:hypothetical protein